jgi:alpha-beta hydrolase superfamily lysophospholipase
MIPLFFGSRHQQLFGIYEPARKSSGAHRGIVLCNPGGNEYLYAHRTMRSLASRLAKAGFHVLRFDYYGTGDSAGDIGEGSPRRWCEDIEAAMSELKDMAGATRMTLIGLRLGANLAAQVAGHRGQDVDALVLWEPLSTRADPSVCASTFHDPAPAAIAADRLSSRTLVLLTAHEASTKECGNHEVAHIPSPSPWIDRSFDTETIPVNALSYIVRWLS